jgi:glycosyltransferase involved in cell wall biosynthesis
MKVLHIHSGNLFGGIETLLVTLARERHLCPAMQPHIALCFEGKLGATIRDTGLNVHLLESVRISRPWTVWHARRQLDQLLRQHTFDVVVCHSCWAQVIFAPVVKAHSLPLVFWCHDVPKKTHWLEQWASRIVPDFVIANSSYTLNALPALYPQVPSERLYPPVPCPQIGDRTQLRQSIRTELNTCNETVVIIQATRLERWKGHTVMLSALAQLQAMPNWVWWIVGGAQRLHETQYLRELYRQVEKTNLSERVKFLGQRNDVPNLLTAADIYCQANTGPDTFGIAFIEALYAGLPVVTTGMGGPMEIVNSSCGKLVAPSDIDTLSQTLSSLLVNPHERAKLASGGFPQADQLCNPQRQLAQLHLLLCQISDQKGRS